jgi:hypothetical protein
MSCLRIFLYDNGFILCAAAKHRLTERNDITLAEVAQERWAFTEPNLVSQRLSLSR